MPSGNHFVVHELLARSEMAFQAFLRAMNHVARIAHAERDRFFMRPFACSVRAEPSGCGPVAVFAGNAFGNFKWAAALLQRGVQRMTRKTFWRVFRFGVELQNARYPLGD